MFPLFTISSVVGAVVLAAQISPEMKDLFSVGHTSQLRGVQPEGGFQP